MPARKSDVRITVEANGVRFSLNCETLLDGTYRVKRGRTLSQHKPHATLTEIFDLCRRWTVKQVKKNPADAGLIGGTAEL